MTLTTHFIFNSAWTCQDEAPRSERCQIDLDNQNGANAEVQLDANRTMLLGVEHTNSLDVPTLEFVLSKKRGNPRYEAVHNPLWTSTHAEQIQAARDLLKGVSGNLKQFRWNDTQQAFVWSNNDKPTQLEIHALGGSVLHEFPGSLSECNGLAKIVIRQAGHTVILENPESIRQFFQELKLDTSRG